MDSTDESSAAESGLPLLSSQEDTTTIQSSSSTSDHRSTSPAQQQQHDSILSSRHSSTSTRTGVSSFLWFALGVYVVLVLLLFTWPRYAVTHYKGDGLSAIGEGMGLVFRISLAITLVSLVALILTIRYWTKMSKFTRILGLFPITSWIVIFGITMILANTQKNHPDDPCDGYDCPKPKIDIFPVGEWNPPPQQPEQNGLRH